MERENSSFEDESKVEKINAILIAGLIISTSLVALRCFTRTRIVQFFGYDDVFLVLAQVTVIGFATLVKLQTGWGLGRHAWVQDETQRVPYMKAFYASIIVYSVGMSVLKISFLLQYRRIFAVPLMQRLTFIGLIFKGCWLITITFLLALICIPVAAFWDDSVQGRCLNQLVVWYLNAAVNIATDFVIFSMPLPLINKLQLRRPQKFMLFGVFCLGFFTCIISILRLRTLSAAVRSDDPTWDKVEADIWTFLEMAIGVIVACLPTLRPFFVRITPRLFGSITPRGSGGAGGAGGGTTSRSHNLHSQPGARGIELPSARNWKSSRAQLEDSDSTKELFEGAGGGGGFVAVSESNSKSSDHDDEPKSKGGYNVEVTGGGGGGGNKPPGAAWEEEGRRRSRSPGSGGRTLRLGGITATTQITQEVEETRRRDPA